MLPVRHAGAYKSLRPLRFCHAARCDPAGVLACVRTFAVDGLDVRPVWVELDLRPGLPSFAVIGLADVAVRESRERVSAAIRNSGFAFPGQRLTANLAPANVPKMGPGFDLALACAVLAASGQLRWERLGSYALFGELSLGGALRPCAGTLAVAEAARRAGLEGLVVSADAATEASLVPGVVVAGVESLRGAAEVLSGRAGAFVRPTSAAPSAPRERPTGDLADVRGQVVAVDACVVAAAGAHNLLLSGPPGVGKTMLAWRVPGLLPELSPDESIEVMRIHELNGTAPRRGRVPRPFRAPHHSVSAAGLVGGSNRRMPGEVALAHHGVLFLDELSEFSRAALEALRQPLEDGRIAIVRAGHTSVHPARFMLVAATNPCPCGYGTGDARCECSDADLVRHARRLSGALLDRLDVMVALERPASAELTTPAATSSEAARELVLAARERQARRLGATGAVNARMTEAQLRRDVRLDPRGDEVIAGAYERGLLSARSHRRVLRVARTIADLAAHERVRCEHVVKALSLHRPPVRGGARAAPAGRGG